MEDGLVLKANVKFANGNGSLNPCCNGRWSSTSRLYTRVLLGIVVLILVVMEDGLVLIKVLI